MSWHEIEKYLFEQYGIEGCYDDELCRLMDEHDKEIRDKAINEFAEKIKDLILAHTYPDFDKNSNPVSIWNADGYKQIDNLVNGITGLVSRFSTK